MRAVVIVIVVAFHSVLPYLASQPAQPYPFDAAPYRWIAFPILDRDRWFGFDLFCAWQDVSLMSLMFFLAGLFTPASLARKGTLPYLLERARRIGLPFLLAVGILSPLAYFASFRTTAADPSLEAFWQHWQALPMWPSGPAWFLWQILLLGAVAAALVFFFPGSRSRLGNITHALHDRPLAFCLVLTALSLLAYAPLAMIFGPWDWTFLGPFSFQLSRPLHYSLYFLAGFALGCTPAEKGLLHPEGPLARKWLLWLAAAIATFMLWGGFTSLTMPNWNDSPYAARFAAALAFPIACATGLFGFLAVCLRLFTMRHPALDALSENAYSIYLVHYVPVVWLQYALLGSELPVLAKAATVLACGLAASWAAAAASLRLLRHGFELTARRAVPNHLR
ncbi:MAG: acyltransferase [Bradyrhizobium sp.]|uniref:acyltransferase family protein n=1 Tax=Bradyrhizobium sp. TaxID=376 RepID=UPI0025BB40BD|nr:acyltransferase [Bradyrhizobium sp.]MBI5265179.1 acyltransferase [Bradyrhizobium sp.]